ncbi:hypothetical protein [Tardiphaga robiniae]|uniref:Uncharacterized protein n=1 Tax=Tardiphaga robiniae TaxID=943830 RepID=A0A7G6TWN3_9BRAD|nr:hypothetical protein [Tardiphaga robiniae]QND71165.1 hypothetical protein HB776_07880 [Tardiphaga robiniae]
MRQFHSKKISDLPSKLSTEGAPAGEQPAAGDINSAGLVKLGHIDEGLEFLARSGPIKVTIERLP